MGNRFYVFGTSNSCRYEASKDSVWHELYCGKGLDWVVGAVMIDSSVEVDRERFAIVSPREKVVQSFRDLFGHIAGGIWHSNTPDYVGPRLTETAPQDSDEYHIVRRIFSLFHPMQYESFLHRLAFCPNDVTHLQLLCDEPVTIGDYLPRHDAEKQFDSLLRSTRDYATAFRRLTMHDWRWFENWSPLKLRDSSPAGGMLWAALNGRAAQWEEYLCLTDAVDGPAEEIRECWRQFVNLDAGDAGHYIDWQESDR